MAHKPILQPALEYKSRGLLPGTFGNLLYLCDRMAISEYGMLLCIIIFQLLNQPIILQYSRMSDEQPIIIWLSFV